MLTIVLHFISPIQIVYAASKALRPQKRLLTHKVLLLFPYPITAIMRWPRINRKSIQETDLSVSHPGSNDDPLPVPEVSLDDPPVKPPLSTDPTDPADPGLSRMFSEAALYEKVLSACPAALKDSTFFGTGDQALQRCIGGFNTLIGHDLGDAERAISGRLAKLSVHNWSSQMDSSFASTDEVDEEPGEVGTPEDDEEETSPTPDISQDAPLDEPKLSPEEIVDLLEQEFGALGPPGEEKLLLETDAAFFQDVIILVGPSLGSSVSLL